MLRFVRYFYVNLRKNASGLVDWNRCDAKPFIDWTIERPSQLRIPISASSESSPSEHDYMACCPAVVAAADGLMDGLYTANYTWVPFSEALRSVDDGAVVESFDLLIFGDSLDMYYIQDVCNLLPSSRITNITVSGITESTLCTSNWGNMTWYVVLTQHRPCVCCDIECWHGQAIHSLLFRVGLFGAKPTGPYHGAGIIPESSTPHRFVFG